MEQLEETGRVRCPDRLKKIANSKITREQLLEKGLLLYKKIPDIIKTYGIKKFKREIKYYIRENLPPDKIIKQCDYN